MKEQTILNEPFWMSSTIAGKRSKQKYPRLNNKIKVDVCVVGGGIVGLSIAYRLAEHGINIALIEKDGICESASGRNTGFILTGIAEHYNRVVQFLGHSKAKRIWQFTERSHTSLAEIMTSENIDCDYEQNGSLILAMSDQEGKELLETYKLLTVDGFDCQYFSAADCIAYLGPGPYYGGIKMNKDAGFNPVNFCNQLSDVLRKRNVMLFEDSAVVEIKTLKNNNELMLKTDHGEIESAMAIMATNGWSSKLIPELKDWVVPVSGQAYVTESVEKFMFHEVIYANFGYEYWRQLPDGRLMIGGFRENAKDKEIGFDEYVDSDLLHGLHNYFTELFPAAGNPQITHAWAGVMGFSKDGLPILGSVPNIPNLFICGGFTGHGLGFAGAIGKTTADLIINGSAADADLFHTSRLIK